ncbi:hypothetical protein SAMN05444483_104111 [Salegentibacter echinorum]|uniref:Uncharacterized protein n=1 Tax=Salegentibacter echinorum TaxID=1073325 RepID=A0A1M5GDD3_SALEC|nr:hypothetical protein [Salegentibacter echinorum]SHG01753.1 hypothetical protein SAMN05444483_104111 [Salegentibacter echinorum]
MKSLNIQISEAEFDQLGLDKTEVSFSELVELIERKINKRTLKNSIRLADKYELSNMTMQEISEEVRAYRHAEDHS